MRIGKLTLSIIAALMTVAGVSAMNANDESVQNLAVETWNYDGPVGQENNANFYSLDTTGIPNHSTCGDAEVTICQIKAEAQLSDPTKPELNGQNPMDPNTDFDATRRDEE